jgi:hypothetical protein
MALITNNHLSIQKSAPQNTLQPLDEKKAEKLFQLYQRFLEIQKVSDADWMGEQFKSVKTCMYAWEDLDVQLSIEEMESILDKTGVLQLRPIPVNCRTAVVGCGNEPLGDAGGVALAPKHQHDLASETYRRIHKHAGAITINPHLAFNPTLVAFFGRQHLPMLKSGELDLIVIEGTTIDDTDVGRQELQRLPSLNGRVVSNHGSKHGLEFSWEDNAANVWESDYQAPPVVIEDLNIYPAFNYEQ